MFFSKFSLSLAFLGSVAAVGISRAQAMMGEDSQKEVQKAAPAAPTPLKQDHPLYKQIRSLAPSGDLTVDHAAAYQQLQNLLEKSAVSPDKMYFQRVLGAREAGIDLKNVSDLFTYGELQGWLSKGEPVTKTNFEAARQLNTLLEKAPFTPNKMYFQRVLGAREAGIDFKNVSDLFTYEEVSNILKSQPTSTQFQAYQNLKRNASYRSVTKTEIEDEVKRMASAQ
ncbi:MAG: hypothetical protein ACRCYZ_01480 [Alphaproteobacteria bacterium]